MRDLAGRNAKAGAEILDWSKQNHTDLRTLELDVQDEGSVKAAVAKVLAYAGVLDVIVHNAGHMVYGPAEAFSPEQLMEQYDVNVPSRAAAYARAARRSAGCGSARP